MEVSGARMFQAERSSDAKVLRWEGEWWVTGDVGRPVWLERAVKVKGTNRGERPQGPR